MSISSVSADGVIAGTTIDLVIRGPAAQRVVAAGAVPPRILHDLVTIPGRAVGERELIDAPILGRTPVLLVERYLVSGSRNVDHQVHARLRQRDIRRIDVGELEHVNIRNPAGPVVNQVVAVAGSIDEGIGSGTAVDRVVAQPADEQISAGRSARAYRCRWCRGWPRWRQDRHGPKPSGRRSGPARCPNWRSSTRIDLPA